MFLKRIKELREAHGLTSQQTADALGIRLEAYHACENTPGSLSGEILVGLARLYHTSVDYILELTDAPEPYGEHPDREGA
ncbi:MAG TPA: helix-turn-helix domain-containing protein [Firmicutes bacterium]|nr:helix-turn-helix domain-containing protein [Bacillota bacterium]